MIDYLTYLYINSKNKVFPDDWDWDFNVPINLPNDLLNKFTHCWLLEIAIPKSFYNLENFKFDLYENNTRIIISLNNGSYTKPQFYNALSSYMTWMWQNNITYVVSDEINASLYDTGKLKIVADGP